MGEFLKCDSQDCDHVEQVGIITADMIDMPCPKCGANLLTAEDWEAWQPFSEMLGLVSDLTASSPTSDKPKVAMCVGLHGKKTTIEIEPTQDGTPPEDKA